MSFPTTTEIKKAIRQPYAWPGGYPIFLVTDDGEALHTTCAREEWRYVCYATRNDIKDGWRIVAIDVNWEDTELYCAHCGDPVESAYGDNDIGAKV